MQTLIRTFFLAFLMVFSLGQMTAQDQLKKPKDKVDRVQKIPKKAKVKSIDKAAKEIDKKGDVVRDQAREIKGKGKGKAGQLKDRANQDIDKGKAKAGETRDRANQEVDKVKMKNQKPGKTPPNQGEVGVQKQKERRANDGVDVKTKPGQSIEEAAKAQSGGKGKVTPRPGANKGGGNIRAAEAQSQVAAKKKEVVKVAKKGEAVASSAKSKVAKAKAKNDADYKAKKIDLAEYEKRKERIRVVEEKTKELESTIDQSQKSIDD